MSRLARLCGSCLVAAVVGLIAVGQPPATPPAKLTPAQQEKLKVRDEFVSEFTKLESAGKLSEARTALEKALAIERDVFGNAHRDVAFSLIDLTSVCVRLEDFPAARGYAKDCLAVQTKLHGDKHWRTTEAKLALADVDLRANLSKEKLADLEEADRLSQLALRHRGRGEHKAAVEAATKALALRRAVLGEKHPSYAESLTTLADSLAALGDRKAEESYREAITVRKAVLGENHPHYADSLNYLGVFYYRKGEAAKAEPLFREALAVRKVALGEKHPRYADSLNNVAGVYLSQGQYAKAEPLFLEALALRKAAFGVKHREYLNSLNNLAIVYKRQRLFEKAEPLLIEILAVTKAIRGEKHQEYIDSLDDLAALYRSQAQFAKAEPLYKEVVAIRKATVGDQHPLYADSLNHLGRVYFEQNLFAKAETLFREALAIRKATVGEKHLDYSENLMYLGALYGGQGMFSRAVPFFEEALAIRKAALGDKHAKYAASLHNLALAYKELKNYARAEPLYREALAITQAAHGEKDPDAITAKSNLAVLYLAQNELDKAERELKEVLALTKEVHGEQHPRHADSLNNLAMLYMARGQAAKAEELYRSALAIRKATVGENHPAYAQALNSLAGAYDAQGFRVKAASALQQSATIMEEHLEQTAAAKSEGDQLGHVAASREYLNNLLAVQSTDAASVYAVAFRWRGVVTARQAFARAAQRGNADAQATLEELRNVATRLSNLVNNPPQPGTKAAELQTELKRQREDLERQLAKRIQSFSRYRESRAVTVANIQKLLPADAVLIDFLAYRDKVAAFIVTAKSISRVELQGGEELARLVKDFRQPLSLNRTRPVQGEADESPLYTAAWEPLLPHIKGAKLVLLCPDGPLCEVPFAALRGSNPKQYLIEEVTLAVIPVPQLLPELLAPRTDKPTAPSLLAIGDVDFDGNPAAGKKPEEATGLTPTRAGGVLGWSALPNSKTEVAVIEKLFRTAAPKGKFKALTRGEASEAAIRHEAGKYRDLHFATHGFFAAPTGLASTGKDSGVWLGDRVRSAGLNPGLLCGLVCAGANKPTPEDDGVLTALEIADLDLGGVELAVLSACQTGLGDVAKGDGVLGLQRAFQLAGVRTTVTSLWSVRDDATSALMGRFYANRFEKDMSPLEALREAQLWMLNDPKWVKNPAGGHRTPPFNWAAFTLAGDWR